MYRFHLESSKAQIELLANGSGVKLSFMVIGPIIESSYIEELLEQEFGSLTANPREVFEFLCHSPWVQDRFRGPEIVEGDLEAHSSSEIQEFSQQPIGQKLVICGLLSVEELEELLEAYRPYAQNLRFGEFLKLNLQVPPALVDFLLSSDSHKEKYFNEQRLGERLVSLGCLNQTQLNDALEAQRNNNKRIGEILAEQGLISETTAAFFSRAKINANGILEHQE